MATAATHGERDAPAAAGSALGLELGTLVVVLALAALAGGAALAYSEALMTSGADSATGLVRFFICH